MLDENKEKTKDLNEKYAAGNKRLEELLMKLHSNADAMHRKVEMFEIAMVTTALVSRYVLFIAGLSLLEENMVAMERWEAATLAAQRGYSTVHSTCHLQREQNSCREQNASLTLKMVIYVSMNSTQEQPAISVWIVKLAKTATLKGRRVLCRQSLHD